MRHFVKAVLVAAGLSVLSSPFTASSHAEIPTPLTGSTPVDVSAVRPNNPAILPMTGTWRFAPTRGGFAVGGKFTSIPASASSVEGNRTAAMAFDSDPGDALVRVQRQHASVVAKWTWARPQTVTGVDIAWEHGDGKYNFNVKASNDGRDWKMIVDKTGGDGVGDGPVTFPETTARFVRLTITSASLADGKKPICLDPRDRAATFARTAATSAGRRRKLLIKAAPRRSLLLISTIKSGARCPSRATGRCTASPIPRTTMRMMRRACTGGSSMCPHRLRVSACTGISTRSWTGRRCSSTAKRGRPTTKADSPRGTWTSPMRSNQGSQMSSRCAFAR